MKPSQSETLRQRLAFAFPAVGILMTSAFLVLHLSSGMSERAVVDLGVIVLLVVTLIVQKIKGSVLLTGLIGTVSLQIFLVVMAVQGNILGYFWMYLLPLFAFFLLGLRWGLVLNIVSFAAVTALVIARPPTEVPSFIPVTIINSFGFVIAFACMLEYLREVQEEELRKLSSTDELTGLSNRRKFEEVLGSEIRRAERYGTALALVVFDIDRFKELNDRQGHPVGDRALRDLARLVSEQIRDTDTLARLGGDEFVVIAPSGTRDSADGSLILAERLREAVATHDFGGDVDLTISLGVAEHAQGDDLAALYSRADRALYEAKRGGRNKVSAPLPERVPGAAQA